MKITNYKIKRSIVKMRQKQRTMSEPPAVDNSRHKCCHCGYEFVGRLCPMCGMAGDWNRFTWRRLFNGFLDIWGLGNRPMFRSIGHLLWRPGYMIRDYLKGHFLNYFPPFKMLAVLTVFVALVIWILDIDTHTEVLSAADATELSKYAIIKVIMNVRNVFLDNALYRLLLQIVMLVAAVWIVFRRKGLNFVETFFAMVYISCQMQLVAIVWLLLTQYFPPHTAFPYALPEAIVVVLLIFDFRQLYGLSFWGALWRTLLILLLFAILYGFAVFLFSIVIIASVGFMPELI